jgi:two-component sensor histidine kinase
MMDDAAVQVAEPGPQASLEELAAKFTRLSAEGAAHIQHLVATWGLLADLSFADLVLFCPSATDPKSFVVLGLARPNTTHTLYEEDPTGQIVGEAVVPYVARCWRSGEQVSAETFRPEVGDRVKVDTVPVRLRGTVIAVLVREHLAQVARRPSDLEKTYLDIAGTLLRMVGEGTFPFPSEELEVEGVPRVGDGIIRLDAEGKIAFASPNAVSALRRLGVTAGLKNKTLVEIGLEEVPVRTAFRMQSPASQEVEAQNATVAFYVIPLLSEGKVGGALVLIRDLSEIRSRDKLILSKDAAIREIHHRVKNNLQTIASLLRLQSRRLAVPAAKQALEESVRRIGAIALVHEVLSREPGDQVRFKSILRSLVAMVEEALVPQDATIAIEIQGTIPDLNVEVATPMAVIATELLQNAVQHGFPRREEGETPRGVVRLEMSRDDSDVIMKVSDNGVGFPPGFDIERDGGLGLQIVHTLVSGELGGKLTVGNEDGAVVTVRVPTPGAIPRDL